MTSQVLLMLSGGMDSAVLLSHAIQSGFKVEAVSFYYGSKHNNYEDECASRLARHYGVNRRLIRVDHAFSDFKSDLLTSGGAIPEGHYEERTMRRTVVPCRNLILGSIAGGLAESLGIGNLWLGVHAGDHAIYPDCRPKFVTAFAAAVESATDDHVTVNAPFLHMDKAAICNRGLRLGTPFDLTRTCYKDQAVACGRCGSCQERLEAFAHSGKPDPLCYESRELIAKT